MKHFITKILIATSLLICMGSTLLAQGGTNDPNFNIFNDAISGNGLGVVGIVNTTSLQADGKLFIGGAFTQFNGTTANNLLRLNSDGTLDNTFNSGTGCNYPVNASVIQPDNKIIIGGIFSEYNGTVTPSIARLNNDGSLDASFNTGTGFDGIVNSIVLQPDGKIIVGGDFSTFNGTAISKIVRLNSDGSIDSGFNSGTGFDNYVNTVYLQPDGKILIGGFFTAYNGTPTGYLARLNVNGSLDAAFNIGGAGFNEEVHSINMKPDGSILVGGWFTGYNDDSCMRLALLQADGTFDLSLNVGTGATGRIYNSVFLPNGKIVIVGTFDTFDGTVANGMTCLQPNGEVDLGFNQGFGLDGVAFSLILQSNNDIVVSGSFGTYNNFSRGSIVRIHSDGSLDDTFLVSAGFNQQVNTLAEQADGKMIVGGDFKSFNDQPVKFLTRLIENGTVDPTFNVGTGINGAVYALKIQNDGKIVVGGSFTHYDGIACNRITRINSDGSIDPTFTTVTGFNAPVRAIEVQQDGKIIVGGQFSTFNDSLRFKIVRLNSDGSLDDSFDIGTGISGTVRTITILPDNRILVGGNFSGYNDSLVNHLVMLNTDGSMDFSFDAELTFGLGQVRASLLQNDGKILVGGSFTSFNNQSVNRIVRIDQSGNLDAGFITSSGCNGDILAMAIQPNGKLLVGGNFNQFGANTAQNIVRLKSDGSLDDSFDSGTGFNSPVNALSMQGTGKVIVGGQFYLYNGINRNRITRLLLCSPSVSSHSASACDSYTFNSETYTATGSYTQTLVNAEGCDSTITVNVSIDQTPNASATDNGLGTLTASSGLNYQWIVCGTNLPIAGANSQSFTPLSNGSYAVVISNNQCSDTSNCVTIDYLDLENKTTSFFSVSPNPASDLVNIQMPVPTATLNITNTQGKIYQSVSIKNGDTIDLSNYASGIYFFQLQNGEANYTQRIIKK